MQPLIFGIKYNWNPVFLKGAFALHTLHDDCTVESCIAETEISDLILLRAFFPHLISLQF